MRLSDGGFEPFGKDFSGAQAAGVQLRFPGQWMDEAWEQSSLGAEIFYNVHRYYENQTGRYTRVDPLALQTAGGTKKLGHVYAYADSQPTFGIDRLGLLATFNCSGEQKTAIQTAEGEIKRALDRNPRCICKGMMDAVRKKLQSTTVNCVDSGTADTLRHPAVCAWAADLTGAWTGVDINFYDRTFTNPGCGSDCLHGTLLHEILHLTEGSNGCKGDENCAYDNSRACIPCAPDNRLYF